MKERTRRVIDCVYKNEEFVEGGRGRGATTEIEGFRKHKISYYFW